MASTYTAKGAPVAKTSGTTLTQANVTLESGSSIIMAVGFDTSGEVVTGDDNPVVKWGTNRVRVIETKNFTIEPYRLKQYSLWIPHSGTFDLVVTFPNAVGSRVATIAQFTEAGSFDQSHDNQNLVSTVSHSGAAVVPTSLNVVHVAHHLTNGPAGDTAGTSSTGYTIGQRVGTTGDTDTSNITLQETYKIVTAPLINAGSFVIDNSYQIAVIGTTDFTLIGAASNTVGLVFVATGVGTGTGTAYHLAEDRSRIIGLTSRDHVALEGLYNPLQTYTWARNFHNTINTDWDQNYIGVVLEDEAGDEVHHVRIPLSVWNNSTATEKRQYVKEAALVEGARTYGGGLDVEEEDTAALTDADTFIDETFTV